VVSFLSFGALAPLRIFFWLLLVAAFVVEAWAFIDALRHPTPAYVAASKQTKPLWLIILGVALVIGIGGALGELQIFSILPIIAFVAAAIYLTDVRPKVSQFRGGSGTRQGPYGPW
jgi:hypothetical protein